MLEIEVTMDMFGLDAIAEVGRQIPFATAVALTRTAKDVQARLIADLPADFTVRSPWTAKGIRVKSANKRNLEAQVGSRDEYMARQATGGVKEPRSGQTVAVPITGRGRARATVKSPTRRGKWPARLLQKPRYFIQKINGKLGLWRRPSKGKRAIQLVYSLVDEVRIPKRWPLQRTAQAVVRKQWDRRAQEALTQALLTARRRRR